MNDTQILLIKNSWNYLVNTAPDAGEHFYRILFEKAPSVRHLFKPDIKDQSRKLVTMISFIVSKLNSLDEIESQIKGLALRHVQYGAESAHFEAVGEALLGMLELELGSQWNAATKEAWVEVYTILSDAMIGAISQPLEH